MISMGGGGELYAINNLKYRWKEGEVKHNWIPAMHRVM